MVADPVSACALRSLDAAAKFAKVKAPKVCLQDLKKDGFYKTAHKCLKDDSSLLGRSNLQSALVRQWVQYQEHLLDKKSISSLQILNQGLQDRTYLAGEEITIADFLLYYSLEDTIGELSFQDRESIIHVSRWFSNLQNLLNPGSLSLILSRTKLY
eukprot:TRINITY_DN18053_c0_g1_i2.p1 TRINITY_DN18053_c0_g1~~TRINITY_DN18053_c0_g1_i2.p1  ORF type:complete len:173 (+),score=12.87 TRINITY_DN18053_c0_g1_i2:53-520(+)